MNGKLPKSKLPPGFSLRYAFRGHKTSVEFVEWAPDGQTLASTSGGRTIQLWDFQTGELLRTIRSTVNIGNFSWSPNGKALASTSSQILRVWNAATGEIQHEIEAHPGWYNGAPLWSPDGRMIAVNSQDSDGVAWIILDAETLKLHQQIRVADEKESLQLWLPDSVTLVSAGFEEIREEYSVISRDTPINLWDVRSESIRRTFNAYCGEMTSLTWWSSGRMLVSTYDDETVRFWDIPTGRQGSIKSKVGAGNWLSFSADESLLGWRSTDGPIEIVRCDNWQTAAILDFRESNTDSDSRNIFSRGNIAFHPTLPILATTWPEDNTVCVWDLELPVLLTPIPTNTSAKDSAAASALKVFLCHVSGDKRTVRAFHQRLRAAKFEPWLDEEELQPGQDWNQEITEAMKASHVILVFLSKNSVKKSGSLHKEVRDTINLAKRLSKAKIVTLLIGKDVLHRRKRGHLEELIIPDQLTDTEILSFFGHKDYENLNHLTDYEFKEVFKDKAYKELKRVLRSQSEELGLARKQSDAGQKKREPIHEHRRGENDEINVSPSPSLKVFLCYGSENKLAVRELYHRLRKEGIIPWFDEEDLLPGQEWKSEITNAIKATDIIIVCLSSETVSKSGFVQREIRRALDVAEEKPEGTIFIIPLKLDECEVPKRLSEWQWVNYYEEPGYDKLMRALERRAKELDKALDSRLSRM